MPANQSKRCLLCGRHGHNLRTCGLPGASAFRKLRAQQSSKLERNSRVLRGTGAAASRKRGPPMKNSGSSLLRGGSSIVDLSRKQAVLLADIVTGVAPVQPDRLLNPLFRS